MGLRHRSIRLRVGVLIAVPVLCLLALYGFVASITLGSAVNQQHATTLKNDLAAVSGFQQQVAQERALAVLSLANPTNTQVASEFGLQERKTQQALTALGTAMHSPSVMSYAAEREQTAISNLITASHSLSGIRSDVADNAITMRGALAAYDAVINAGYPVIDGAIDQQSDVSVVTQALDIVDLDRAAQATQAEWDLLAGDMAQGRFPDADRLVFGTLANQRQTLIDSTVPQLDPQYQALLIANVSPAIDNAMTSTETAVVNTPWRRGAPPARLAASQAVFLGYARALGTALTKAAAVLESQVQHNANTVILQLILAAGLGLIGTVVSVALSLVIGRGLIRQLRELRESALTLAHEKLPDVITRLRAGDSVDIADYAPSETSSANEIDQVQHAFSLVQQSAVRSAIDESRLRRGISDVFRNLAGRSQSLLHRQLTLLDGMERRATEPDELEDLFRIDHLTTRMRRHAEGLIILSGEAPARGWRQPVPLVDVLRAAVAEVEDYTRIRVLCRTNAAVAGHAVADLIHLIAELAENATVFSPPNTPVRIQGDVVGRGLAVEIEDRGLGISAARLEEINTNLDNPPQFDLSGSDRLGLFIAGQLAQRHDIKITLRPSVYGGTTAIVIIPTALVVDAEVFERDPSLLAGHDDIALTEGLSGRHAALAQPTGRLAAGMASYGLGDNALSNNSLTTSSLSASGLSSGSISSGGFAGSTLAGNALGSNGHGTGDLAADRLPAANLAGTDLTGSDLTGSDLADSDLADSAVADSRLADSSLAGDALAGDTLAGGALAGSAPGARGFINPEYDADAADYIGRGFSLGGRTASPADLSTPTSPAPARPTPASPTPASPTAASYVPVNSLPVRSVPVRSVPASPGRRGPTPSASDAADSRVSSAELTELGLPVRIRQASLAPQLRDSPPAPAAGAETGLGGGFAMPSALAPSATGPSASGPSASGPSTIGPSVTGASTVPASAPPVSAPPTSPIPATPEAARNTVSALQRGWQLGRSEADGAAEPPISVFTPRKSPTGQAFGPHDPDAGSTDPDPADSADERGGE
jgi:signal transduction histidine kinase